MSALHARVAAAQATFDAFHLKVFDWGRFDCWRLAAHDIKGLGHKPGLARFGDYRNERAAARAMLRAGFRDPADIIDDLGFPRIAPAAALPGDILGFRHPGQTHGWTGLSVHIGQGRVLAFGDDGVCHAAEPRFAVKRVKYFAWRIEPCPSSCR